MPELSSHQRSLLRSLAHSLQPVCYIGKNGATAPVIEAVKQALADHELIKLKFNDYKDEKKELAPWIATETDSALVGLIGNIAIFYRQQPDPEKRRIALE